MEPVGAQEVRTSTLTISRASDTDTAESRQDPLARSDSLGQISFGIVRDALVALRSLVSLLLGRRGTAASASVHAGGTLTLARSYGRQQLLLASQHGFGSCQLCQRLSQGAGRPPDPLLLAATRGYSGHSSVDSKLIGSPNGSHLKVGGSVERSTVARM
jgi:hypothetical protein